MSNYVRSLAAFVTSGGVVNSDRLHDEVAAKAAITVVLDAIDQGQDEVTFRFRAALSPSEEVVLDTLVAAHNGVPLPSGGNIDSKGNPIFAPTFLAASEQARLEGYEIVAEPGAVTILDVEVTSQMLVQGGQFWIVGSVAGDKCQFAVVDKNDVLGLHTANGIPLGTPIELVRYVKNYRLPPVPLYQDSIVMPTVAPVAPGLFLRAQFDAVVGGGQRRIGVLYHWYIGS